MSRYSIEGAQYLGGTVLRGPALFFYSTSNKTGERVAARLSGDTEFGGPGFYCIYIHSVRYIKTVNFGVFNFDHFKGFAVFNLSQPVFNLQAVQIQMKGMFFL